MDDFNVSSLHESKNEWSARLITILTPLIIDGYKSILAESIDLCRKNNEMDKYLMTFQNLVARIPKWNNTIIETERKRICDKSGCVYLEDLITCVHIIQLKILSAMRVGQKQKKIDINIPKIDDFIHKVYINVARKVYTNVYLFEQNIPPLQTQKHNRELEVIIQEYILNTIRESIPVETILEMYLKETTEEDVVQEVKESYIDEPLAAVPLSEANKSAAESETNKSAASSETANETTVPFISETKPIITESFENSNALPSTFETPTIKFNDVDAVKYADNQLGTELAPKTDERLKEITELRRQMALAEDDGDKIKISDQSSDIQLDIQDIDMNEFPVLLDDIEVLE
jgi:hypothetical protein